MRIKKKTIIYTFLGILFTVLVLLAIRFPRFQALVRSRSHFTVHPLEPRILYEPGARGMADQIAAVLAQAIEIVERGQESHNAFIGHPPGTASGS